MSVFTSVFPEMRRHVVLGSLLGVCLALVGLAFVGLAGARGGDDSSAAVVSVEILEGLPDKQVWELAEAKVTEKYAEPAFGFVRLPQKYTPQGLRADRSNTFALRAEARVALPAGEYRWLLRSRNAARVYVNDELVISTNFIKAYAGGHEAVPPILKPVDPRLAPIPVGHQEKVAAFKLDGEVKTIRLEAIVGGAKLRPEVGELSLCVALPGEMFRLLTAAGPGTELTHENWDRYYAAAQTHHFELDRTRRKLAAAGDEAYWDLRHQQARDYIRTKPALTMPKVSPVFVVRNPIDAFIAERCEKAGVQPRPACDDWTFLRRVSLDTIGTIPTPDEVTAFFALPADTRRAQTIDKLLRDDRWADHWVSYWQDVLAENPGILKPTLNNTGPFRWYLHEALLDNKPLDRMVSELLSLGGSQLVGGTAGFGVAAENDAPLAAKAHIVGKAFLGMELQCARCHDAPYHPYKQQDLFSLAAMLGKGPLAVPSTSSIPKGERERRSLVEVTLEPGVKVSPNWPFPNLISDDKLASGVLRDATNPRERLSALLTVPQNERFAQVAANRLWKRYLDVGLVEPVDDWHNVTPSHPELLDYLARELTSHQYDIKHLARLVLNSHTYQQSFATSARTTSATKTDSPVAKTTDKPSAKTPDKTAEKTPDKTADKSVSPGEQPLFHQPVRRRLSAEQIVDSLFVAAGKEFQCEELTFDPDGRMGRVEGPNLGVPTRSWQLTSLSNERDRPALSLPVAQSLVDVLSEFGWRDGRQSPQSVRDHTPTALQPLVVANGVVGNRIARLSDDSRFTDLALKQQPVDGLIRDLYVAILTRPPTQGEVARLTPLLAPGYEGRLVANAPPPQRPLRHIPQVSWSNHLHPEASKIKLALEQRVRDGDPITPRLQADWRERLEDVVWSLVNSPEFLFAP